MSEKLKPWNTGVCLGCGKAVGHQYKYCASCCFMGPRNPRWKGGRHIHDGYVRILRHGHPRANNKGYVFEHDLVMESMLGRMLEREEVVHHINGDRADNRPENLRLFASGGDHTSFHMNRRAPRRKDA